MTPGHHRPSSPPFSFGPCNGTNLASDFGFPVQAPFHDALLEPCETAYLTPCRNGFSSYPVQSPFCLPPQRRLCPVTPSASRPLSSPSVGLAGPRATRQSTVSTKNKREVAPGTQVGRWTKREHDLFLEGLHRFGKSWKKISSLVHTRTLVQIRTHAQKYLQKQSRSRALTTNPHGSGAARDLLTCLSAPSPPRRVSQRQDTPCMPALMDEYYTSPTAIEDDLLGLVHASELWVPQLAEDTASAFDCHLSAANPIVCPELLPVPDCDSQTSGPRPSASAPVAALPGDDTNVWL